MNLRPPFMILLLVWWMSPVIVSAAEVVQVGRWHMHNSFWMSLHQSLMHDVSARRPRDFNAMSPEQKGVWNATVALYKTTAGSENITFADPMVALQNELTQVADDALNITVTGELADALRRAAPVYRTQWWSDDERANRFYIAYAAAMLRDAGDEIAAGHEKAYGARFPPSVRVDITPFAGRFGAYTHSLAHAGLTLTIASRDPGNAGLSALELILHESSHGIVGPRYGSVAAAIAAASKERGIEPPRDLWHAILFATTSHLTKHALTARGAAEYVPFSADLLTRAWPQYREPIEKFLYPYLEGKGTLKDAVEQIVAMVK